MVWFMNFMKPTEAEAAEAAAAAAPKAVGMSYTDGSVENMVAMSQMQLMAQMQMMKGPPVAKAPSYQPKINMMSNPAVKNAALVASMAKTVGQQPQWDVPMMGVSKAKPKGPVPVGMQGSILSPPIQKANGTGPVPVGMLSSPGVKAFMQGLSKSAISIPVVNKQAPPAKALCLQFEMGGCPIGDACPLSHVLPE